MADPGRLTLNRTPPSAAAVRGVVAAIVALVIVSRIADVTWPTLVDTHPMLLIAMSSINRYLILTANKLDALSFYGVGSVRLLLSDPLFFLLGYWYGDRAIGWATERAPSYGRLLRGAEKAFGRLAYPLVFIAPNNWVCLLAGGAGLNVKAFFAVNAAGTAARLYLIRRVGERFESPIEQFTGIVAEHRIWFVVASAALVAMTLLSERRRGGGDLAIMADLDDLDDEADSTGSGRS